MADEILSQHDGVAEIAGLLDLGDAPPPRRESVRETRNTDSAESKDSDDLAPQETEASEQDASSDNDDVDSELDETEQDETPAIEPPKSWSADDKELFSKLPPEAQQVIARRESERDKAINQRMQQVAEERKAIEADLHRVNQVQVEYAQTLNQLASLTAPELQQFQKVDWQRLAQDDPAEYVRMNAQREGAVQRYNYMVQEMQRVQQQQQAVQLQTYQARLAEQHQKLVEMIPEFRDQSKAQTLVNDIGTTLHSYGFSPEEIAQVGDARMIQVAHRLGQLEKAEAARKSAQSKKGGAPAPRFMTSSAATNTREDAPKAKLKELNTRLSRSGSRHDALAIIEQFL